MLDTLDTILSYANREACVSCIPTYYWLLKGDMKYYPIKIYSGCRETCITRLSAILWFKHCRLVSLASCSPSYHPSIHHLIHFVPNGCLVCSQATGCQSITGQLNYVGFFFWKNMQESPCGDNGDGTWQQKRVVTLSQTPFQTQLEVTESQVKALQCFVFFLFYFVFLTQHSPHLVI